MILIIDNYDSFTYNLVQYIGTFDNDIKVYRNDKLTINDIINLKPKKIVISPGPGIPENAGISIDIIKSFKKKVPIIGICLGHQAVTVAFGGKVKRASEIVHGKTSKIYHSGSSIFKNIPNIFNATRYHSLVADNNKFPNELKVTAKTKNGLIMALEHKIYPIFGVQFHPESIVTEYGKKIL